MKIGLPKEVKCQEFRVVLLPSGVQRLCKAGHAVVVETNAGAGAGFPDAVFRDAGASIADSADAVFNEADLIVKVKEPLDTEFQRFRDGQALFAYLHSETRPGLVKVLLERRITALAFENVSLPDGTLPLLAPMSIIAGQQAILQGMQFLYNHRGGNGRSLATYPGLAPARVLVIGAGSAGLAAARIAAGIGADVTLVEICTRRIRELQPQLPENVRILHGGSHPIPSLLPKTDMLVNTATIPPDASVHLVNRVDLPLMRQGSVIVDVTANLRGAIETVDRYTTHDDPVYEVDGIVHYVVSNIPGSVAHTSSQALAMEVFPYILRMAELGIVAALRADQALLAGLTAVDGLLTWHEAGENLSLPWIEPAAALARIQV